MKKILLPIFLLTLIFAGCSVKHVVPTQACTEEAKLCSDGSAVGRTGPNCEFTPCPMVERPWTDLTPPVACTMEAKMCPDGSAVGRTGPNCEFTLCPGEVPSTGTCTPTCTCPAWYRQDGDGCTPECYYSTPRCLMPSVKCEVVNECEN